MRLLVTALLLSCCAVTGYSQDTEEPVVTTEEGGSGDVAQVESRTGGCGCGKNKPKA